MGAMAGDSGGLRYLLFNRSTRHTVIRIQTNIVSRSVMSGEANGSPRCQYTGLDCRQWHNCTWKFENTKITRVQPLRCLHMRLKKQSDKEVEHLRRRPLVPINEMAMTKLGSTLVNPQNSTRFLTMLL